MPWADALYAHDIQWWKHYTDEVKAVFQGDWIGAGFHWYKMDQHKVAAYPNSGCGAISAAIHRGAKRIILLGYDCQKTGGQAHHHGDHPPNLGNAKSMPTWMPMFDKLAAAMKGKAEIINASRETALTVFPRMDLELALESD